MLFLPGDRPPPKALLHLPYRGGYHTWDRGAADRADQELSPEYQKIAVITTCVPSLIGEDLKGLVDSRDVIFIDIPGFLGEFELGYLHALEKLPVKEDPQAPGVNLDGLNLMDPFCRGNIVEGKRILDRMNVPTGTVLCNDRVENLGRLSPYTIGTNPDLSSGRGRRLGSMLGLEGVRSVCCEIANHFPSAEPGPVFDETDAAEDLITRACDRYLKRYDPPSVLIFGVFSYALCVAELLKRFLDADILLIGSRNGIASSPFRTEQVTDLDRIAGLIRELEPDLVFGSSFEHSLRGNAGFVALTPPLRGTGTAPVPTPHRDRGVTLLHGRNAQRVYGSETKNELLKAGNTPADTIRAFHFHTAQNERLYTAV